MRTVNKSLKKVYFYSLGDTPCVWSIAPGLERITWNTYTYAAILNQETQPIEKRSRSQPLEVYYLDEHP